MAMLNNIGFTTFIPGRSARDGSNTEGNLHRQGDDAGGVGDGLSF